MPELEREDQIKATLKNARTIAVLGAHHAPSRPAFYVPEYLHAQGYRVLPVNPTLVGKTLFGEPVRATLAELGARNNDSQVRDMLGRHGITYTANAPAQGSPAAPAKEGRK